MFLYTGKQIQCVIYLYLYVYIDGTKYCLWGGCSGGSAVMSQRRVKEEGTRSPSGLFRYRPLYTPGSAMTSLLEAGLHHWPVRGPEAVEAQAIFTFYVYSLCQVYYCIFYQSECVYMRFPIFFVFFFIFSFVNCFSLLLSRFFHILNNDVPLFIFSYWLEKVLQSDFRFWIGNERQQFK